MKNVEKLLAVARDEIGTAEGPAGSNRIKYNTAYYGREVSGSAYPWCMVFVWWCFQKAGLGSLFYGGGKTASCTALMRWAQGEGRFTMGGYRAGDVFLYQLDADDMAEHTGIYTGEKDARGRYLVIEGNHSDRVALVARTDTELWGAFRPEWEAENIEERIATSPSAPGNDEEDCEPGKGRQSVALPEICCGDKSSTVKAMQILLIGWGFPLPRWGADGEYGAETGAALKAFQQSRGLRADGVMNRETWRKLLGV